MLPSQTATLPYVSVCNIKNPVWQDSPPAAGRFSGSFYSAAVRSVRSVFYFIGTQFPMKEKRRPKHMLRANKSVIPPNFRISLHSTSTSILSPITPEPRRSLLTSYFLYGIKPFQSAARGPVPTRLHGNFHHPSPLFASGREVLLPVTTFLCLVKVITAIIRGGRISCQAFSRPVFFYIS